MKWLCRRCGTPIEGSNNLYCDDCLEDDKKIDELEQQGHTPHCACRLVWGDGICICKKDYTDRKIQSENLIKIIKEDINVCSK